MAVPGDPIVVHRVFLAPGERTGVVVGLPPAAVRSIRETGGGTVTVTLHHAGDPDEPAASVELDVPAE